MGFRETLWNEFRSKVNSKGYCDSYTDNIYNHNMEVRFQDMFENGNGGELHSKAEAVHSSSMLAYNFFHWISGRHPFVFNNVKYTNVFFEVKLRTLKCSGSPANIDVVLEGVGENNKKYFLFIESKFTEYFDRGKFKLSNAYLNSNNWYTNNVPWTYLVGEASALCAGGKCYADGIKQSITHLFGLSNLNNVQALDWFNTHNGTLKLPDINCNIMFANFVFAPNAADYTAEYAHYACYRDLYADFIGIVKGMANDNLLIPQWYSYSDIWLQMSSQIDNRLAQYLNHRYMKFADYD